jgi:hypothetical protein
MGRSACTSGMASRVLEREKTLGWCLEILKKQYCDEVNKNKQNLETPHQSNIEKPYSE